jgi:predicted DNA-binding transcriptional regulator AlpA
VGATVHDAPTLAPLLTDAAGVAKLLGIGKATVWRLVAAGQLPPSVKLSRRRLWRVADLESFVACGCDIERWRAMQAMQSRRSIRTAM